MTTSSIDTAAAEAGQLLDWDGQPLTVPDEVPGALWAPKFATAEQVDASAALLPDQPAGSCQEGPSWRISVSPGKVKVSTKLEASAERTENRQLDAQKTKTDMAASFLVSDGKIPETTSVRGEITQWSRKSQTRMREGFADLDYTPWARNPDRPLAMGTVTYPGCWLRVCPDKDTFMGHLEQLRKRYRRAFGEDLYAIWKKEFQGRKAFRCGCEYCGADDGRAPHAHLLMQPPRKFADGSTVGNFNKWLGRNWAAIVAHPDEEQRRRHAKAGTRVDFAEGMRCVDPRRTADYFAKHSGGAHSKKAYQHFVPQAWEGRPGRFWGYWGLQRKVATVEVSPETGTDAGRLVRRYSRAQGRTEVTSTDESTDGRHHENRVPVTRRSTRARTKGGDWISKYHDVIGLAGAELIASRAGQTRYRHSRTRAVRAKNGRGWISLNNGPQFAAELAYGLRQRQAQRLTDTNRAELDRCGQANTPAARARALPPGPKRDALVATFEQWEHDAKPAWLRYPTTDSHTTTHHSTHHTQAVSCSVCGHRLTDALAARGRHIGDCLDTIDHPLPASPLARSLPEPDTSPERTNATTS